MQSLLLRAFLISALISVAYGSCVAKVGTYPGYTGTYTPSGMVMVSAARGSTQLEVSYDLKGTQPNSAANTCTPVPAAMKPTLRVTSSQRLLIHGAHMQAPLTRMVTQPANSMCMRDSRCVTSLDTLSLCTTPPAQESDVVSAPSFALPV